MPHRRRRSCASATRAAYDWRRTDFDFPVRHAGSRCPTQHAATGGSYRELSPPPPRRSVVPDFRRPPLLPLRFWYSAHSSRPRTKRRELPLCSRGDSRARERLPRHDWRSAAPSCRGNRSRRTARAKPSGCRSSPAAGRTSSPLPPSSPTPPRQSCDSRNYRGAIRIAPSRRIVSPLSMGLETMCAASAPYSLGSPRREGWGTC